MVRARIRLIENIVGLYPGGHENPYGQILTPFDRLRTGLESFNPIDPKALILSST